MHLNITGSPYAHKARGVKRAMLALLLLLILMAPALLPASSAMSGGLPVFADEFYDIQDYDVHMVVGTDNVYHVSETITASFKTQRHGIFRDIPITMYGYRHAIRNIKVTNPDTGKAYPFEKSRKGEMLSIRIGDPDIFVEGIVPYQIQYTFDASDDRNRNGDELYFNLIGTEWDASIGRATMRVDMPKAFDATELAFYTGPRGSTDTSRVSWRLEGNSILAESTETLGRYQGITLLLPLEEGYFSEVSRLQYGIWTGLLLLLHAVAFGVALYAMFRDANGHKIVPILSFRAPQDLNPAEAAYVYKEESITNNDVAPLIIHWAARGLLRIEESERSIPFGKGKLVFYKMAEMPPQAPAYEKTLFARFWGYGSNNTVSTGDLSEVFHSSLTSAAKGVAGQFKGDREILVNRFQSRTALGIAGQLLLTCVSIALVVNLVMGGGVFLGTLLISGFALGLTVGAILGFVKVLGKGSNTAHILGLIGFVLVWFLFVSVPLMVSLSEILPMFLRPDMLPMVPLIPLCLLTVFVLWKTKVFTPYALALTGEMRGFRNFLATAKRDRLEMLFSQDPTWFYDMLPYAMVFGLTGIWERHMITLSVEPPNWYNSSYGFHPAHFTGSMRSVVRSAVSTPSQSSGGGGGGGSSGGGGGGGGGGSW